MEPLRIIALGLAVAIGYGIVHDQVSVRIAPEYLILAHPRLVDSDSPTVIALAWGVAATWWVGLPLGCLLAAAARAGSRPKISWRELLRPVLMLLVAMAAVSGIAGIVGHLLGKEGVIYILEPLASEIPEERHAVFLGAFSSHIAAYAAGVIGGLGLCAWVYRRRRVRNVLTKRDEVA